MRAADAAACASSPERYLGSNAIDVAGHAGNAAYYAAFRAFTPEAERQAWQQLWADVEALRARAASRK